MQSDGRTIKRDKPNFSDLRSNPTKRTLQSNIVNASTFLELIEYKKEREHFLNKLQDKYDATVSKAKQRPFFQKNVMYTKTDSKNINNVQQTILKTEEQLRNYHTCSKGPIKSKALGTSQNHIISDSNLQKLIQKIVATNPSDSNKEAILKLGLSLFEDSEEHLKNKAREKFSQQGITAFICFVASRASRNAKEGDASINKGINDLLDPMLNSQGKPMPQQQYVVDKLIELSQIVTKNDDGTRNSELFSKFLDVLTTKFIRSRDNEGKIHTGVVSSSNSIKPHLMKKRDFSVIDSSCFEQGRTSVNISQLMTSPKQKQYKPKTPAKADNNNLIFPRVPSAHK